MKAVIFACALLVAVAHAQTLNETDLQNIVSGYTGGSDGSASPTYLTTMATTLATGFTSSIGGVMQDTLEVIKDPHSWSELVEKLEDQFCTPAKYTKSYKKPAKIVGPEIDISFSGGACLLNETAFKEGTGDLTVDCIAPSLSIGIVPASISAPYKNATKFTDKSCEISKDFGESSDKVVYVLDKGLFDIKGLVQKVETDLAAVLGQFTNSAGSVVESPGVQPLLQTINAATALLG